MKRGLDYGILNNPNDQNFLSELKKAPRILNQKSAKKFYSTVLKHFSGELEKAVGNEILLTICMLLQNKSYVSPFVSGNLIDLLPFEKAPFRDQLMDLLCFLVKADPNSLPPEIAPKFAIVYEKKPAKSLTLLAYLALKFDHIQDPWPIFEMLVKRPQNFGTEDLIGDYVALLIYLNKNFEPFRKAYSTKTWRAFSSFLTTDSDDIAKVCLCGLCALYDIIPKAAQKGGFPTHEISRLLVNPNTKGAAIPLLLRTQPKLSEGKSQEQKAAEREDMKTLLSSLFEVAHSDKKATLILMEMANDENIAKLMVKSPKWIGDELPTTIETVRLFAVVLAHKELREAIMQTDIVISLFSNMISQDDPSICSIICTFVRRLPITPEFVKSLGQQGLIRSYIELFLKSEDPNVTMSGLLFVDTISAQTYHKDYIRLIDNLMPILKKPDLAKTAAAVTANLAKHPELNSEFEKRHFPKFFKRALNDDNLKKQAKKFLRHLAKNEENN